MTADGADTVHMVVLCQSQLGGSAVTARVAGLGHITAFHTGGSMGALGSIAVVTDRCTAGRAGTIDIGMGNGGNLCGANNISVANCTDNMGFALGGAGCCNRLIQTLVVSQRQGHLILVPTVGAVELLGTGSGASRVVHSDFRILMLTGRITFSANSALIVFENMACGIDFLIQGSATDFALLVFVISVGGTGLFHSGNHLPGMIQHRNLFLGNNRCLAGSALDTVSQTGSGAAGRSAGYSGFGMTQSINFR